MTARVHREAIGPRPTPSCPGSSAGTRRVLRLRPGPDMRQPFAAAGTPTSVRDTCNPCGISGDPAESDRTGWGSGWLSGRRSRRSWRFTRAWSPARVPGESFLALGDRRSARSSRPCPSEGGRGHKTAVGTSPPRGPRSPPATSRPLLEHRPCLTSDEHNAMLEAFSDRNRPAAQPCRPVPGRTIWWTSPTLGPLTIRASRRRSRRLPRWCFRDRGG